MPKIIVVLISWTLRQILNMISFTRGVVGKMTDNPNFTDPAVPLDALTEAASRAETAYTNRKNGPIAKMENELASQALDELLRQQANYVDSIAQGNPEIIISAGYKTIKGTRTNAVTPGTPGAPKVERLVQGGIKVSVPAVPGATGYMYAIFFGDAVEIEIDGDNLSIPATNVPIMILNGTSRQEIRSIPAGTKFNVMALAQNAAGKSSWGPMISAAA
jgi:hypothetical protein